MESEMNNDISRDYVACNKVQLPSGKIEIKKTTETLAPDSKDYDKDSLDCLGNFGYAQVNMDRNSSVQSSVDYALSNPIEVEAYNSFYETMLDEGYTPKQALSAADIYIDTLKQEKTYH